MIPAARNLNNFRVVEKDLIFLFHDGYVEYKLTVPIKIPLHISVKEYTCRLVNAFHIPCYVEKQLETALDDFVHKETNEYYTNQAESAMKDFTLDNIEFLAKTWTKSFREEHVKFAKPADISDEAVFSDVYHNMIHLGALDTLMKLEHSYSMAIEDLIKERDRDVENLLQSQGEQMETAVKNVGVTMSDDQVNSLAARHFEDSQLIHSKWASELKSFSDTQKRTYVDCVMKFHEDYHTLGKLPTQQKPRSLTQTLENQPNWAQQPNRMEESFTIHLGAQMKQMHNLRLVATNALSFCWQKPTAEGGYLPQRFQMAMSVYSSNLCAVVLLVDKRVNSYTGIKREFSSICQRTSEFHFSDLEDQFEEIRQEQNNLSQWRSSTLTTKDADSTSVNSGESETTNGRQHSLNTGDFYITRHSGLSDVHVVIHLVIDDSLHSGDITSRHPVILGLRNVLKVACMCDITTITLPLFLVHEMSEEMTISWCLKRAELIFKCIKGFMMEMASWGGQGSRTVQFLVPNTISEDLFATLATMLPSIFRISNPLVVKS